MLGCVYLILAALLGREITHNFLPEQRMREKGITPLWVTFAASFGSGVLLMTWAVYIAAWLLSVYSEAENPLFGANLMVMAAVGIFLLLCCYRRKGSFGKFIKRLSGEVPPAKEIVFLLILLAGITWIMVFVFHVSDGYLYSGFTVFGDYAPHTAMMRSFSLGNNFPTQYPHFGGEDVKYHFMFQFLVGNLEYLEHGGRIGKVASIAGKLLNVKPLITLKDGEIYSPGLKRGRKKSMAGTIGLLLDYMEENGYTPENCSLVIGYCYGYEEAESFQKMLMQSLEEKFGTTETVPIHRIGATIGVHTGPYAIGIGIIRRSDMV